METTSDEKTLFGFFLEPPSGRIYQKVKGGVRYECGTLFYVDVGTNNSSNIDYTNLIAFTPNDSEFTSATNPRYVGMVAAVEGLNASVNGKITISNDAKISIDDYNTIKSELIKKNGSTTMGLPLTSEPNSIISGFGVLKLTKLFY